MDRIRGHGNGLLRLHKVMKAQSKLRSVIEYTGSKMIRHGIRPNRRELMIGPDKSPGALNPRRNAMPAAHVPTQNGWRNANPRIRAAGREKRGATERSTRLLIAIGPQILRGIGLPK